MESIKIEEIFEKVKKEGEIFLKTMTAEELKRSGFAPLWGSEREFFGSIEYVDIYLLYDGEKLKIKYIFNGKIDDAYYESQEELGKYFEEVLEKYIEG
ncbi:MAG: hypothetical protein L7G90_03115 [Candidatus Nanopusillus sp.]|nr:hypothetical protein [Candidatus Nanopusillus sp.]MCG2869045.1 hypothetical protein [Candidatus Nanopusillus sp.]